ncbi:polysaccharide deacetylase family protein [Streptomyces sp. 7N604]|uniref:polysaccharide deacetylase family protein n=1 Tax=Streptomyces sp. 7N604 TaxID=3457415 RepID=UPI003FD0BE3C
MRAHTVALTFDGGPDSAWTPRLLELLAEHNAHATALPVPDWSRPSPRRLLRGRCGRSHATVAPAAHRIHGQPLRR